MAADFGLRGRALSLTRMHPDLPRGYFDGPPLEPPAINALATGAMVTGIASVPLFCICGLGLITGIIAVVLGGIALARSFKITGAGRTSAIVALAAGATPWIILMIFTVLDQSPMMLAPAGGP